MEGIIALNLFPVFEKSPAPQIEQNSRPYDFLLSSSYWNQFFIIAVSYYLMGRLGQLMSIPPGNVTPVWPPSGIALAAVLLYGYRIWPAIFLGALFGNTVAFYNGETWTTMLHSIGTGVGISIGASLQAVAGKYLIATFGNIDEPIERARDVIITLTMGALSCLVNSTIGTSSLCLGGFAAWSNYLNIWWTWFLGDTAGIFVFTPLLWVWIKYPFPSITSANLLEICLLLTCLFVIGLILLTGHYPIVFTLIPPMVWASFRLKHHGATGIILLTSAIAIWGTIHGAAPFQGKSLNESLLLLQVFIGITTMLSLILASTVTERESAQLLLVEANLTLEDKVKHRTLELEDSLKKVQGMQQQIIVQEKLASLGKLTAGIAHEIKNPLNFVNNFAELSQKQIKNLEQIIPLIKERLDEQESGKLLKAFATLDSNIKKVHQYGLRADDVLKNMLSHARGSTGSDFQATDINALLEENFKLVYHAKRVEDSTFNINMQMKFDDSIGDIEILPQEIGRVIINLLNNAFYAVDQKKKELDGNYLPTVTITSKNIDEQKVLISVHDNGTGILKKHVESLYTPFFTTKPPGQGTGLGLSLSHEVIVDAHHGEIKVDTKEGAYTVFTIILPKKQNQKKINYETDISCG